MKDLIRFDKIYDCMDESCKFIIDSQISTMERNTSETPLTRKQIAQTQISTIQEDEVEGYISTRDMDWSGDIVIPEGIVLDVYQRNPLVLFNHDSSKPPIGKATKLMIDDYGVKARIQFAPTEMGQDIMKLMKGGFISTFSVGFIPLDFKKRGELGFDSLNDSLVMRYTGYKGQAERIITKWILLEFSAVQIPDNSHAVVTQKDISDMEIKQGTLDMLGLKCGDCEKAKEEFKEIIQKEKDVITEIDKNVKVIGVETIEKKIDRSIKIIKSHNYDVLTKKGKLIRECQTT